MPIFLRILRRWSGIALAAFCLIQSAQAKQLKATFVAAQSAIPTSSLSYPYRVAVDSIGNVYISNTQANEVLKETWSQATESYTESVIVSSGLATPYGIAVDSSGNVYIADNGHNRVVKETPSASGYTQTVVSTTTALSYPTGVAVDSSGNLYIADTGGGKILKEVPSGSTYTETVLTYSSNFAQITGIAVDASGNIYVSDIDNNAVYEETYSAGSYTPSTISTSGLSYPYDIAVDANGNLYIADFSNVRIVEENFVSPGTYTQSVFPTANLGGPLGLAVDPAGNLYIADTFGQTVQKETLAGGNFETVAVGNPSSTIAMLFSFTGGNVGDTLALSGVSVLTQGISLLDFADAGGDSCSTTATYSAGDSCYVNVALTPQYPGQRYGAVELSGSVTTAEAVHREAVRPLESSSSLLATGYVTGLAIGPQVNFLPFSFSNVSPVAGSFPPFNLTNPFDSVVDPGGNVYVLDYNNNAVYEETPSAGSYTQSVVATGLNNPEALALDGAGNVYIADSGNNQILMESWQNGSWVQSTVATGLDFPTGVAVDALGNVYFSSFSDGAVYLLTLSEGGYSQGTAVTGLNEPRKIALDGNGDIFIADTGNSRVVEETPNGEGYSQTVIGSGMTYPYGVAVGAAGQVYVADTINSRILLETPSGDGFTQSVLIPGPPAYGIAVDGQGSLYFPDPADATVFKVGFSTSPGLSFAGTIIGDTSSDSPQSVTVWNIGNALLGFPVPQSGINPAISAGFVLDASTTCPEISSSGSPATLAPNATCLYAVDFAPTTVSSYSGSLTLTDNSLNVTGTGPNLRSAATKPAGATRHLRSAGQIEGAAMQAIPLTGTGLPLPATQLALTGVPAAIPAGGNLGTATVDVENGNGVIVTGSSASVTVTITGPGGYSQAVTGAAASGVYAANLTSLPLTVVGVYTVTATSPSLTSATSTAVVEPAPVSLGSIPVGTASSALTVTFPFATAVTLGAPGVEVLTQGAAGLDFANAGTGTCTAGAAIGAGGTCTVAVTFTPGYPGPRYGAVLLEDASGNVLATAYLHGIGVGPQALFPPGAQSMLTPDTSTYFPEGIAVDSQFNLFFVDGNSNSGSGAILEFPWTGSSYGSALAPATLNLPGSGYYPTGTLAVDGAGNLYAGISNYTAGKILKFPWNGSAYGAAIWLGTGLVYPISVTADGNGNLFIADPEAQTIVEIPWDGGSANAGYGAQATIAGPSALGGDSGQYPTGIAVDQAEDVFFIGQTGPTTANLVEIPFTSGSYSSSFATIDNGLYDPYGVVVDTNGNLYVNDTNGSGTSAPVYEYLSTGGAFAARTQLFTTPNGGNGPIALDSAGSLYVDWNTGDGGGAIYKQNRAILPTVAFSHPTDVDAPDTADDPQSILLLNYGNANLTFASPSSATNPALSGGFSLAATTTCPKLSAGAPAASLTANSACVYAVDFTPPSAGAVSGSAVLTDNNLNHPATSQSIALSGTGVAVLGSFLLSGLPSTSVAGASTPFLLTARDAQGLTMASYTGTVHLTASDAQAVFSLTAGGAPISSYTFVNADAGVRTLYVIFKTAGEQTATAADTTAEISVTSAADLVTPAAAAAISSSGPTAFTTTIGALLGQLNVSVADAYGNPVQGVTVTFAVPSSGPGAVLTAGSAQTTVAGTATVAAYANPIAGGPYTITATAQGLTGSPVGFTGTNLPDSTSTTLAASPGSTSVYGTVVTLTATVTPAPPAQPDSIRSSARANSAGKPRPAGSFSGPPAVGPPTGTVSFYDTVGASTRLLGTSTIGGAPGNSPDSTGTQPRVEGTPPVAGTAAFTITAPLGGGHSYTAAYGADANFTASTSTAAPYTVTLATATVAGPATQPVIVQVDQAGSIPVTVTGPQRGAAIAPPTGSVSYTILNSASATVGSGTATLTAGPAASTASIPTSNALPPGSYTLRVSYLGDGNYAASVSPVSVQFQVSKIPTVIVWPQPAAIVYGASLGAALDATAKAGSAAVPGAFAYTATLQGGTAMPVTGATVLPAGAYTLTVTFTPTDGATYLTSTGSVTLTVEKATAAIALVSSANPQYVQDPISFTATVTSSAGVPTGSVAFFDGSTLLGTVTLTSGVAVYTTSSLALGSHSVTGVYSGDTNFAGATSTAITESVQDFNLSVSTASGGSSSATALPGAAVTYPLVFTPVDGATFPQPVQLSVSGLPPGATAALTPDILPAGSGTTPVTLTVNLANTAAARRPKPFGSSPLPLALGLILLPFAARIRRTLQRLHIARRSSTWLAAILFAAMGLAAAAGLAGCGGTPTGYFGQAPQTYTLTITGTSGELSHSTTVTLTVE